MLIDRLRSFLKTAGLVAVAAGLVVVFLFVSGVSAWFHQLAKLVHAA